MSSMFAEMCKDLSIMDGYLNDIHDVFDQSYVIHSYIVLNHKHISSLSFADDSCYHSGSQNKLNTLQNHCLNWQLTVNTTEAHLGPIKK